MVNVLCVAEDIDRAKFFCRFESLSKIFVTTNITVYIFLKFVGEKSFFIGKGSRYPYSNEHFNLNDTIEVRTRNIELEEAEIIAEKAYLVINNLHNKYQFGYIFLWNGCKIIDVICKSFAQKHNLKTLFFEIANIPGKLFVDKKGTNRQASIFSNPELLDDIKTSNITNYKKWFKQYLSIKEGIFVLPQSKKKNIYLNACSSLLNILAIKFNLAFRNKMFIENLRSNFYSKKPNIEMYLDDFKKVDKKYLFVPLQVSNDTQVMINSSIGLYGLIDTAVEYSKSKSLSVVVKPHPAEQNIEILEYICAKKDKNDIVITNDNTFKIIKNAECVMTINSTVGLEAMILEKKVITLGDAVYSGFNPNRLRNYIMNYLVDVEYFSNERISEDDIEKILKKSE